MYSSFTDHVLQVYTETDEEIRIRLLNFKNGDQKVRLALKTFGFFMSMFPQIENHYNYLKKEINKTANQLLEFAICTNQDMNLNEDVLRINRIMIEKLRIVVEKYKL